MGISLLDGRLFESRDVQDAPEVVIVIRPWPPLLAEPKCHRPPIAAGGNKTWCMVIGIVDDVKNAGLDRPAGTEIYLPFRQPSGQGSSDMYV